MAGTARVMVFEHEHLRVSEVRRPMQRQARRDVAMDLIFGFQIDKDRLDAPGEPL